MASVDVVNSSSGSPRDRFQTFFDGWLVEQNQHLQQLISISSSPSAEYPEPDEAILKPLIGQVVQHYEHYYRAKSQCAEHDVLAILTPPWRSSLEDAFLWIGGWRPSMAFHLLYSKSGLQVEAQLAELIRGLSTGNLSDLFPDQISRIDQLHRITLTEEKNISEKLAKHQESVADSSMVTLSHIGTQMLHSMDVPTSTNWDKIEKQIESKLESKEEVLQKILKKADALRLNTLKNILGILCATQGIQFLIAAAELHLRFHEWGKKRDAELCPGA